MNDLGPLDRLAALDTPTCAALRDRLRASGFGFALLGETEAIAPGLPDALRRPLVEAACLRRADAAGILARLLAYDLPVTRAEATRALGPALLGRAAEAGLVAIAWDRVEPRFRVLPLDALYLVCDPPDAGPESAMGAGPTTQALSRLVGPAPGRVLDLGCGAGALALHAARLGATRAAGVDLSPRAVALARLNARLNGLAAELHAGDLVAPVAGERFDLVLSQPPYVPLPEGVPGATFLHGGARPDALLLRFARAAAEVLAEGGRALLSVETPAGGKALHDAVVAALRGAPLDVVTLSSRGPPLDLQAVAYATLADGSLGEAFRAAARRYADHLHALGGEPAVALVVLRRREAPAHHAVHVPVPAVRRLGARGLDRYLAGLDLAIAPEPALLAARLRGVPGARLVEERQAGETDAPATRAVRLGDPIAADHEVGEAGAALLDVMAAPGTVEDAVTRFAALCGEPPDAVRGMVVAFARDGLRLGLLHVDAAGPAAPAG